MLGIGRIACSRVRARTRGSENRVGKLEMNAIRFKYEWLGDLDLSEGVAPRFKGRVWLWRRHASLHAALLLISHVLRVLWHGVLLRNTVHGRGVPRLHEVGCHLVWLHLRLAKAARLERPTHPAILHGHLRRDRPPCSSFDPDPASASRPPSAWPASGIGSSSQA